MTEDPQRDDPPDVSAPTHRQWASTEALIEALTDAVATETGRSVADLPPLYDSVEMEALQTILTGQQDDTTVQLSFNYAGTRINVDSEGYLSVQDRTGDSN